MSLASNPLLQLTSVSKTAVTSVTAPAKVVDTNADTASSFAELYAKHSQGQQLQAQNVASRAADRAASVHQDVPTAKDSVKANATPDKPTVADNGKTLPAKHDDVAKADKSGKADKSAKADKADKTDAADQADASASADAVASGDDALADATADDGKDDSADAQTDVDPGLTAAVPAQVPDVQAQAPVEPPKAVVDTTAQAPQALDPSVVASMMPAPATAAPVTSASTSKTESDPAPDALADLPAVRLALEQSAKAQGTTSAHAKDATATATADSGIDSSFVNTLASQVVQQQGSDADTGKKGDDKDFSAIIDGGLKDVKDASADTRMDNFANRLQNLTEAATAKTASATPLATPLAMNQTGWSEGLVNRVMYLSSQNLKSADIQLSPAELGKLDIRVDMTPDQQTQVTFVSAHIGVRDALESQQGRLKEMFAQQGLGQMDVNVSDQSRNQQGQQQQADQANRGSSSSRGGSSSDTGGGDSVDSSAGVAAAVAQSVVIGSSAVDYYA
ncbi:flagellar hook-length control protein FliK [Pseudomonas sp. dw_358]|uniref:flagellar hook-length control protein FliK n=1 Tax=Pseudomonas sp. dw_358 TaxID=2720083 RepID=UPI001BD3AB38|nr:flagellar hook-length control protein FliK [Pseudomonas sp. dw_358]